MSSFSAKIDLSYALQIIPEDKYDDLTVIRKIRNQFAHSISLVNFDSPEIRFHFQSFKMLDASETNYQLLYLRKLQEIETHLQQQKPSM